MKKHMIKKLLALIFFMTIFVQTAFAQEVFKVTSVNFDTSNAMIFLTSPDTMVDPQAPPSSTAQVSILKNIKLTKLTNPNRAFFDINSAILTAPAQNFYFNSGGLKQIKIGQFSTNPNKIRVVLYFADGFDPAKVSFLKINNNLAIKLKDGMCKETYFQNTYRDEHSSNTDFFENLTITNEDISSVKIAVNAPKSDAVLGDIQHAFSSSTAPESSLKQASAKKEEIIKKELTLKSKYYINKITAKPNGIIINGVGSVGVEKPIYLADPARVVFDLPNTVASPEYKNKEFKISDTESIKMAQFSSNKVRIVIVSPNLEKYVPIFSADGQSLMIANPEKYDITSLFTKTTDAVSYFYRPIDKTTDEFIIAFNSPIVHSVRRDPTKLTVYLYNALRYNEQTFKNSIQATSLEEMKLDLLPKVGLKLTLPLKKDNVVDCYLGQDAKSIRIKITGSKSSPAAKLSATGPSIKRMYLASNGKKQLEGLVVLDPGHGGLDYGAMRDGINEKDITLDVSKRVEALLEAKGVKVYMTRDKDATVSLQDRTTFCENHDPDIFVSIHVNSSTGTQASGVETHYYHANSINMAKTVHSCLIGYVKSPDRGLFKSRFYVINHTTVPAILVEIGFISNDKERSEIVSEKRKQQTAKGIAEGILKYLNVK